MRKFEKISMKEFEKFYSKDLYQNYSLPVRKTLSSAGYDFLAIEDFVINPGEIKKIPTGYKVAMNEDEVLFLLVRSSAGFKYNVRICNQVGVIDSDYYNNVDNEGHIFVALQNHGDKIFEIKKGEGYSQGIFSKFLITEDDVVTTKRVSGIGSTNERINTNEK